MQETEVYDEYYLVSVSVSPSLRQSFSLSCSLEREDAPKLLRGLQNWTRSPGFKGNGEAHPGGMIALISEQQARECARLFS